MPGGRPTKLTPEIIETVRNLIPVVLYWETLCDFLEIERKTFYNWLHRGEAEEKRLSEVARSKPRKNEAIYLEFLHAVKKGKAEGAILDLKRIKDGEPNWQASAWRLERHDPEKWGRKDKREIDKNVNVKVTTDADTDVVTQRILEFRQMMKSMAEVDKVVLPVKAIPHIDTTDE